MTTLGDLEKSEYDLVGLLFDLPMSEVALRTKATDTLRKVRAIKAKLLRRNPDVLRKGSTVAAALPPRSPLIDGGEVRKMVREAVDRVATERRLSKGLSVYDPTRRETADAPLAAIRRVLAQPYRESAGLFQLLTKRG
jgi:hypothetical protein